MTEILSLKVQRELKPEIEDVLPYFFDGESLEAALSFIAHLRANKMSPRWAGVHSTWNCNYRGKIVCYIRLGRKWIGKADNVKWEISPNLIHMDAYEIDILNENMQDSIWNGLSFCRTCNNGCSPGVNKTILNKDFTGLCYGMFFSGRQPISFINPDEKAMYCIKRILEMEKQSRDQEHNP